MGVLFFLLAGVFIYLFFSGREKDSEKVDDKQRKTSETKLVTVGSQVKASRPKKSASFQTASSNIKHDKEVASVSVAATPRWRSIKFAIVGLKYYTVSFDTSKKENFTKITLRREPTNRHDTNAVEVLTRGEKVGYVNKEAAGLISEILAAGATHKTEYIEHFSESVSMRFRHK